MLRQLAPGGPDFPEFGQGSEQRLANLRRLVDRAGKLGIDVYLYMNEPRAMPVSFFASRPELAGVREGDHQTMCTSTPTVRNWLTRALEHVFRNVPKLGGVFTITASENLTSCPSHGQQAGCPRCKNRNPAQILAEVNAAIAEGVHRGSPKAKVIVWDWGWPNPDPIAFLPRDVWFMSVSEWSLPISRGGIATTVGEYSLSAVGPGPRATRHWAVARDRGLKTLAKVQLNNSWELSSVPTLPVLDLVARHCAGLARQKVSGMMMSWSLGGCPSANLLVAERFAEKPDADVDTVLDEVAAQWYGAGQVRNVRAAWTAFSTAFSEFPYNAGVLYSAPSIMGRRTCSLPGQPATRRPWSVFPTTIWRPGAGLIPRRSSPVSSRRWPRAGPQAAGSGIKFRETLPQAIGPRFVRPGSISDRSPTRFASSWHATRAGEEMIRLLDAEARTAAELLPLTLQDSRIGFESSNQYYYTPLDLVEKVINCEFIKAGLTGGQF